MKHLQHQVWELLYPHFRERTDFIISVVAPFLRDPDRGSQGSPPKRLADGGHLPSTE
jgi:hypothetical protein